MAYKEIIRPPALIRLASRYGLKFDRLTISRWIDPSSPFERYLLEYAHTTRRDRYRLATLIRFRRESEELAAEYGDLEGFWRKHFERAVREIVREVKRVTQEENKSSGSEKD